MKSCTKIDGRHVIRCAGVFAETSKGWYRFDGKVWQEVTLTTKAWEKIRAALETKSLHS